MSDADEHAHDEHAHDDTSLLPLRRYGGQAHPAIFYRPPLTRMPLFDYWLFHGAADMPLVAVVRGDDRLGYRFGLHWLLTAAVLERTRVGAITVDGASDAVWRDIASWRRRATDWLIDAARLDPWQDAYERYEDGEAQVADSAYGAFHRLCDDDPFGYHDRATPGQRLTWRHQRMRQELRRHRMRRLIPLAEPTIRPVSLGGVELLGEPWRSGHEWSERIARPLMLLIVTDSRDPERLRVLRDHARWTARFTEGFVLLCEPDGVTHAQERPRANEIQIRIGRDLPSWLPESTESGEPFALHARYAGNPRPTFALEIVDRGDGVFA